MARGAALPGHYAIVPPGADPATAFGYLFNQLQQKHGMPGGKVQVSVVSKTPGQGGTSFMVAGDFDSAQGGPQKIVALMFCAPSRIMGTQWTCTMSAVTAPKPLFDGESATLFAMSRSLSQNGQVLQKQGDDASAAIARYGESVRATTKAKGDAFDEYMKSIDRTHDAEDKNNMGFALTMRDQAVVENIPSGYHGTISSNSASALVDADPQNWKIVPNNELIKGRDY
jgi:hypothetical protein